VQRVRLGEQAHRDLSEHRRGQTARHQDGGQQGVAAARRSGPEEQPDAGIARHKGHQREHKRNDAEHAEEGAGAYRHAQIEEERRLEEEHRLGVHGALDPLHLA